MAALSGDKTLDKLFESWDLKRKQVTAIDIHIPFDGVVEIKITCLESSGLIKKFTEEIQGYSLTQGYTLTKND